MKLEDTFNDMSVKEKEIIIQLAYNAIHDMADNRKTTSEAYEASYEEIDELDRKLETYLIAQIKKSQNNLK